MCGQDIFCDRGVLVETYVLRGMRLIEWIGDALIDV